MLRKIPGLRGVTDDNLCDDDRDGKEGQANDHEESTDDDDDDDVKNFF